ncbi:hypothetical protein G8V07_12480 [Clostridium botulinum D/C]|nr:hypothetical protein [Clostridium botulinum]MCD3321126.1 hypothetical protein [Clostridium botulinum D/C]MCD3324566.1 hypothetical protein [Clostridium botulinum D/C]MCD3326868.1 hypothetical protein [Clostridium botulinum D/C]
MNIVFWLLIMVVLIFLFICCSNLFGTIGSLACRLVNKIIKNMKGGN